MILAERSAATTSLLASFATLKGLLDEKKYQSPYQILQEFIRYIVLTESLYTFSASEMKNELKKHFDFEIPEAVVKTSAKNMSGITLNNGVFTVVASQVGEDSLFQEKKKEADDFSKDTIKELSDYVSSRMPEASIKEETLLKELLSFLIGDQSNNTDKLSQLIGEFVLINENNNTVQNGLSRICEGSVIYIGLCHNVNEVGSISKPLNLFLSTEILFSLSGYNGAIYLQLATEFLDQVRLANSGGTKKINLYYFSETKNEICDFFGVAEDIVEGKKYQWNNKPAMKAITDGCKTAADVSVKQSDFFTRLRTCYGIVEDPNDSYYDEEYFTSNLESLVFEDETDEEDRKRKRELGLKLISHINKLRNGYSYSFELESRFLIVTNTNAILSLSKEQTDVKKSESGSDIICGFAVSLNRITNLLWYKLGSGFSGRSFPTNVNAVLKARTVLSSTVAKKANQTYNEIRKQFKSGEISEDQVAARIIILRGKVQLPEHLHGDDIVETLDFSPEFLSRFEEQFKDTKNSLKEKEKLISFIQNEASLTISEKDATIKSQKETIQKKEDENAVLKDQLLVYTRIEKERQEKKMRHKNIFRFIWSIIWKLFILVCIAVLAIVMETKYNNKVLLYVFSVIDSIGAIGSLYLVLKRDKEKYLGSKKAE